MDVIIGLVLGHPVRHCNETDATDHLRHPTGFRADSPEPGDSAIVDMDHRYLTTVIFADPCVPYHRLGRIIRGRMLVGS